MAQGVRKAMYGLDAGGKVDFYDKKDYKNAQLYLEKAISVDSKFQYAKKYLDKIK